MKSKFTIIELLAVLAIIGIIAAIVIPNIRNTQGQANLASIHSNVRNIQTAVDMYSLDNNGRFPTLNKPTEFTPEPIDFTLLHPDFLRNLPEGEGVKYWVDFNGKIWASTVDSPRNLYYGENTISWQSAEGAVEYQVFQVEGYEGVVGSPIRTTRIRPLDTTTDTEFPREEGKFYVVNTIDPIGLESAPAGLGYVGFPENYSVRESLNNKPVAVITMQPHSYIFTTTEIEWSYENSTHPKGLDIVEVQWENKHTTYAVGEHTIRLRVKDEHGVWSEWASKTFNVEELPTQLLGNTMPSDTVVTASSQVWNSPAQNAINGNENSGWNSGNHGPS